MAPIGLHLADPCIQLLVLTSASADKEKELGAMHVLLTSHSRSPKNFQQFHVVNIYALKIYPIFIVQRLQHGAPNNWSRRMQTVDKTEFSGESIGMCYSYIFFPSEGSPSGELIIFSIHKTDLKHDQNRSRSSVSPQNAWRCIATTCFSTLLKDS